MFSSTVLLLTAYIAGTQLVFGDDKLISVSLLYRHGDRTIITSYANDPYMNESFWPVPFGELTTKGKRKQYALGKWLRERYDTFLSRTYLAREFYLTSSNYDRCLMSAASNLAGLYPPEGEQIWNEAIPWQPIPIHTSPYPEDGMLALTELCPEFERLLQQYLQSKQYLDMNKENDKLYEYLTESIGTPFNTIHAANDLYDTLFIENLYNYILPNWTHSVFPDKLRHLALVHFSTETSTPEMAKFRVGQFFNEILNQFDSFVQDDDFVPKFKAFSAHDTNVFNILNSLRIPHLELVPYAGMVIFELKKRTDGTYFVNFYYKKNDELDLLTIEGCTKDCDYEKFKAILKPLSLSKEEWRKACIMKGNP